LQIRSLTKSPNCLYRIEYRAVRGQGEQTNGFRQAEIVDGQMESRLVLDHDVQRLRIGGGDLLEEERVHVLVDAGCEEQFQPIGSVHFQRFVEVASGRIL
jgi:hypothetical protein